MVIKTTAPIAIEELKKYFTDKTVSFEIDYANSTLQGEKLLTYLSNLEIPCNVVNYDEALLGDYLRASLLVNIPSLEGDALSLLFMHKNGDEVIFKEEIALWEKKIDSLTLFNMYTINVPEIQEWVEQFPTDESNDLTGINFISLLKHEGTYELFQKINEENLTYYPKYFNDYMFKGNNLYSYWANESNPLFLLTWGISTGVTQELKEAGA